MARAVNGAREQASQDLRLVLASGYPLVSAGLRRLLESEHMVVLAEVEDFRALHNVLQMHSPDVCLLVPPFTRNLPGAISTIRQQMPQIRVVVLSGSDSLDEDEMVAALHAGAAGWLRMDMGPDRLTHALEAVRRGEYAVPRQLVGRIVDALRNRTGRALTLPDGRHVELTTREWEVLSMLADGIAGKQIAHRLQLSDATVRGHVAAVLHKFDVGSRVEAIRCFLGRG